MEEEESGEEHEETNYHVKVKSMEIKESRIPCRRQIKKMREKLNKANPSKHPKKDKNNDKKKDKKSDTVKLSLPNTSEEEKDELAGSK